MTVELCLEALATGRVNGISPNHDPAHSPFFQTVVGNHGMVRDFGLYGAHFTRWTSAQPWQCQFLVVQADEWAWRWSRFVLDRPGTVPVGEVGRTCLAALPMSLSDCAGRDVCSVP